MPSTPSNNAENKPAQSDESATAAATNFDDQAATSGHVPESTQVDLTHRDIATPTLVGTTGNVCEKQLGNKVGHVNPSLATGAVPKETRKPPSSVVSRLSNALNAVNLNVAENIPLRRSKRYYHCSLCDERDNSRMVQCDSCDNWYHFTCAKVTEAVAEVDWNCPSCGVSNRTNTLHPGDIRSLEQASDILHPSIQQHEVEQRNQAQHGRPDDLMSVRSVRSVGTSSKASSNRSRARRAMELQLLKLEEDRALQQQYLDLKFAILQAYDSDDEEDDVGSIIDKVSKVEQWIQRTDNLGNKKSGLPTSVTAGQPPSNSQPVEHTAHGHRNPSATMRQATHFAPTMPNHEGFSVRYATNRCEGVSHSRPTSWQPNLFNQRATLSGADFVPGQRSTPNAPRRRFHDAGSIGHEANFARTGGIPDFPLATENAQPPCNLQPGEFTVRVTTTPDPTTTAAPIV
nr:uncharacterized protein LOC115269865 [Aedes albopictus]